MSNEIGSTTQAARMVYSATEQKVGDKPGSAPAATPRDSAGADSVELTSQAKMLQKLEQRLADFPAVDSERVAAIKQAIADGTYEIDAGKIADRMLQLEKQQSGS